MLKENKWAQCPHCDAFAEKIDGCNFMYCSSQKCLGLGYFCYLCNCVLTEAEHFNHFINDDPFNSPCINTAPPKVEGEEEP